MLLLYGDVILTRLENSFILDNKGKALIDNRAIEDYSTSVLFNVEIVP